jgi:hypothetical protein
VPGPLGVGPDGPDHRGRNEGEVRFEDEDVLGCGPLDDGPAGSVVDPLVGEDTVTLDTERGDDPVDELLIERASRTRGGAAKDRTPSPRRTVTRSAANGSSLPGVKIRSR